VSSSDGSPPRSAASERASAGELPASTDTPSEKLELSLDLNARTTPLSPLFRPNVALYAPAPETLTPVTRAQWSHSVKLLDEMAPRLSRVMFGTVDYINDSASVDDFIRNHLAPAVPLMKKLKQRGAAIEIRLAAPTRGQKNYPSWLYHDDVRVKEEIWSRLVTQIVKLLNVENGLAVHYVFWEEPDHGGFGTTTELHYFEAYAAAVRAARSVDPRAIVGGPTGTNFRAKHARPWTDTKCGVTSPGTLIENFIAYAGCHELPIDFLISNHFLPIDLRLEEDIRRARDQLAKYGFRRDTPIINGSWTIDGASAHSGRRETLKAAAQVLYGLFTMAEVGFDNQTYFRYQTNPGVDGVGQQACIRGRKLGCSVLPEQFTGSYSMISPNGVVRPVFNALALLGSLGKRQIPARVVTGGSRDPDLLVRAAATVDRQGDGSRQLAVLLVNFVPGPEDSELIWPLLRRTGYGYQAAELQMFKNCVKEKPSQEDVSRCNRVRRKMTALEPRKRRPVKVDVSVGGARQCSGTLVWIESGRGDAFTHRAEINRQFRSLDPFTSDAERILAVARQCNAKQAGVGNAREITVTDSGPIGIDLPPNAIARLQLRCTE
jgi:hypothetical protein